MKKAGFFFIISIVLVQYSCLLKKEKLDKVWFYTHTTGNEDNDNIEVTPASFINLQQDGRYTRDFGIFDYGRWEKNETGLILRSTGGKSFVFPVKYFSGNELQLLTGKGTIINFEGQPGKFPSDAGNPFSIENNRWRMPSKHKETELEIKNRLRNHFRFSEIYIKWALDNHFNTLDVGSTPSLLKVYSNGFALRNYEELPAAWRSYFYDEEDCRKANAIIKDIFDNHDIAWAHTDNRFKMFVSAFQQLQQLLK